ncbi:hypothetical protein V5353_003459 [Enterobacter hormaechei]
MSKLTYLHFPDEETAKEISGWWGAETGWVKPSKTLQIAVRGVLYNDDGEYGENGEVITEPTIIPGFHIDVIYGDISIDIQKYIVEPVNPYFILA